MFFKFSLLFIGIVLGAAMTVLCLIFMIIALSSKKSSRWGWVTGFCLSCLLLFYSIHAMTRSVQNAVTDVGNSIEASLENSIKKLDSSGKAGYHQAAKINHPLLDSLKQIAQENDDTEIPDAFYTYWGFRDYYRLPITFPFSLHCIDDVDNAQLFNEKWVTDFDRNDNGETALSVSGIHAFAFDKRYLLAELKTAKDGFVMYDFKTDKMEVFQSKVALLNRASQSGFTNYSGWHTCRSYFERLH